jgi:hypothetical protein
MRAGRTLFDSFVPQDSERRVEIEKPDGGGMRKLGIPTVADRIVQQVRFPRKLAKMGIRFTHQAPIGSDRCSSRVSVEHNRLGFGESNGYPSGGIWSGPVPKEKYDSMAT